MPNIFEQFLNDEDRAAQSQPRLTFPLQQPTANVFDQFVGDEDTVTRDDLIREEAEAQVAKERESGFTPLPNPGVGLPIIGGLLDEAAAGIESLPALFTDEDFADAFEKNLAVQQARERASREANPGLGVAGDIGAGFAGGGTALKGVAAAPTLLGRAARTIGIGGGVGATDFATRSDRLEDVPSNAVTGAGVGATIGGLLPPLASLGSRALGAVRNVAGPPLTRLFRGADEAAEDILGQRIAAEGSSPAAKRLDLQQGQAATRFASAGRATLPETIADTSPAMQSLLGSAQRTGGEAKNFINEFLETRQRGPNNPFGPAPAGPPQGQAARITDATERSLLLRTSRTARQTEHNIRTEQAREGRRLYEESYRQSEPFSLDEPISALGLVIQNSPPPFAAKLNRARNLFITTGTRGNQANFVGDVRRFDASKKALDDMIESAQRRGENNLARELVNFKDSLLRRVHGMDASGNATQNLAYLEARQTWGSAAENRQAIELGRQAMRENSEISVEQFRELTTGQRQLFRVGFLESLRNTIGRKRPGNDVTQIFQEGRIRDLMNEIIPVSKGQKALFARRRESFGDLLQREQRLFETRRSVTGGSPTAPRQMEDAEFAGDALRSMWNRFRSSPSLFNVGVEAIGAGIQRIFGYNQQVALQIARRLLETDPTARNQLLRRLARRGGPNRFAEFVDGVDRMNQVTVTATPQLGFEEVGTR